MKKLLNTLFVVSPDSYLSLENKNVVITRDDQRTKIPLIELENILNFGIKGISPKLAAECVTSNIGISQFSTNGRFLYRYCGPSSGNIYLRMKQYNICQSESAGIQVARNMIYGKLYNTRWTIERFIRDHGLRIDKNHLKNISNQINLYSKDAYHANDYSELRGIEGKAATLYFGVFNDLILNQKETFVFENRTRRPPLDRVNAMLSFGYSVLANDCASALEGVGLDSFAGIMHQIRPGRISLALDLMEELRCLLVDHLVIKLINTKQISENDFIIKENCATFLNDSGRTTFLQAWQAHKREEIIHPFLKEKINWGLVPYVQALLLSRYLRDDLDAYPVFLWK